jgi:membrane-associated phospholipid phosphatase/putative flippase GtrA
MLSTVHLAYRLSIALLLLLTVMLLLFSGVSGLGLPDINGFLFEALNAAVGPYGEIFWANLTNLGDGLLATVIGIAIFARIPRSMLAVFLSVIIVGLSVNIAKIFFNAFAVFEVLELRPVGRLLEICGSGVLDDCVNVIGRPLRHYSFPSGHSAAAATMATLICLKVPSRAWCSLVVVICVLSALSRSVVGAHWPVDITSGAMLGVIGTLISVWLVDHVIPEPDEKSRIGLYLFAMIVSLALFWNDADYEAILGVNWVENAVASVALLLCVFRLVENIYQRFRLSRKVKELTRHELVVSFVKFGMVGASGFVVDTSMFFLFKSLGLALGFALGLTSEVARVISYCIASTWNWFFNRAFTFSDAEKDAYGGQWTKYFIMCVVSSVPNVGTFVVLTRSFDFFEQYNVLALIAGVGAGMMFNFLGARFIVFNYGKSEASL